MQKSNASFAKNLRRVRESVGLSQYAVAKQAGISKQAMSQLEQGENDPSWSTVQKLALVLGVDCRQFVDPDLELPGGGRTPKARSADAGPPKRPKGKPRKRRGRV
jgi:transcriptional regulator with XRE-family HTH domain